MRSRPCDWACAWSRVWARRPPSASSRHAARRPSRTCRTSTLRAALERRELEALADAGALRELAGNRHLTFWQVAGTEQELPLAPVPRAAEGTPLLRAAHRGAEHRGRLSLRRGSRSAVIRWRCCARSSPPRSVLTAAELRDLPHGRVVRVAGIVTARQRPQSAGGVMFITLEDESGFVNLIVWETRLVRRPPHRQQLAAARGARPVAEGRRE